jgi:hypothetical protein
MTRSPSMSSALAGGASLPKPEMTPFSAMIQPGSITSSASTKRALARVRVLGAAVTAFKNPLQKSYDLMDKSPDPVNDGFHDDARATPLGGLRIASLT